MKVLVVATRGADKSSTLFRWSQYEPTLERCGLEIEHVYKKDVGRRRLRAIGPCDWVVNLRCLLNGVAARAVAAKAPNLLFDFDDAIYTRPGPPYGPITARRVERRLRFWMSRARIVTTSSRHLAAYATRWARHVEVIPMTLDLDTWAPVEPRDRGNDGFRVGWVGSPATLYQIERLDGALAAFLRRHPEATLAVYSGARPALGVPFEYAPYRPGHDRDFIRTLDVGLLPLVRDDFTMGKSPIKALQYLACSVPVVANRFGATEEILDDSNSLPVERDADWADALETLLGDADRRRALGRAGRERIEARHDAQATAVRIHALLAEAGAPSPVST
jgi:glycosyltransferase involved in cell wall biosynthesis